MTDKSKTGKPASASRSNDGSTDALAASLFAEVFIADQLARELVTKALPGGMRISHFSVLNLLAHLNVERTPAELAEAFHVTRGAMTNTLSRLEWAGHIHIRPDWDDARRKFIAISPAGRAARDAALAALMPQITQVVQDVGADRIRATLPVLRLLRKRLEDADASSPDGSRRSDSSPTDPQATETTPTARD